MVFAAGMADAATVLHSVDPQQYRDEATLYPMVGKLTGQGYIGSGVSLGGRWVLTAGHVADFKTGGKFQIGGTDYTIESYVTAPGHLAFSTTNDMGLVYLSEAVTGIPPAVMIAFGTPEELLGREATWVGNGLIGTGLDDVRGSAEMRAFTNVIDGYSPRAGLPQPSFFCDFDNPDGTSDTLGLDAVPTRLEGNVTPGDSGGGVFVAIGGAQYLVGISSYTSGFAPGMNSKYGSLSGAADLGSFLPWITATTGISAVPEPSSAVVFAMLGAVAVMRRRRIGEAGRF